jgi:serine/threonine-protein kinase
MIPSRLLHYEMREKLGSGGMGDVWKAFDTRLEREVAIKFLHRDLQMDALQRTRFEREAKAASALSHPNIVTIHEINSSGGLQFIVMELVRGRPLAERIREGSIPVLEALHIVAQVSDALDKAHAAGIVHRDLKPGNIMICDNGLVKVVDFGLAKLNRMIEEAVPRTGVIAMAATNPGAVFGTVTYMSPEQARGEPVDSRSDIFALGIVFYEMLTGDPPFEAKTAIATLQKICFDTAKTATSIKPELPGGVNRILSHALQKKREDRYQTMGEMYADLRRLEAELQPAPPAGWRSRAMAVVAVTFLILLGWLGWMMSRSAPRAETDILNRPRATPFELYSEGRDLLNRYDKPGNRDRSIRLFNAALAKDPNHALSYAGLAEAHLRIWSVNPDAAVLNRAVEFAERAIKLADHLAVTHAIHGAVLSETSEKDRAMAALNRALDLDPKSADAHKWIGREFSRAGRLEDAERHYRAAIEAAPKDWSAHYLLGILRHRQSRYQEALEHMGKALELAPDNALIFRNMGGSHHMLGNYADAAAAFQRSLEIAPSAVGYGNLGTLRFFEGKYEETANLFEKAIQLGANSYANWGNMADAYRWIPGREKQATEAYDTAIRLARERAAAHPEDVTAHSSLATYLAKTGNCAEALNLVRTLPPAALKRSDAQYKAAVTNEVCRKRDAALQFLGRAVALGYAPREIEADPELVVLRRDPRYQTLARK